MKDDDTITAVPNPFRGNRIAVYWPEVQQFYRGKVTEIAFFDPLQLHIAYDDGHNESLDLENKVWRYNNEEILPLSANQLMNNEQSDLCLFPDSFEHKDFMKFAPQ